MPRKHFLCAVLLFAAMFVWFAGCGDDAANIATTVPTPTQPLTTSQARTATTALTTARTAEPAAGNSADRPSGQDGTPAPAPASEQLEITEQSVSPASVQKGGTVAFTVKVKGNAKSVTMLFGQAGGDVATAYSTVALQPSTTSAGITTWTQQVTVIMNGTGTRTFFFKATALTQDDVEVETPGTPEAYQTFTVHS